MKVNKIKNTHKKLLDITFIAVFAALCYIALTVLFIPFANMYLHFGNLIVVLAALLIGGWQGGLAGSLGMGLYDIFNGHADSSPKTFILKLLIGLTVGGVYNILKRKNKFPSIELYVSSVISFLIAIGLLIHTFIQNNAYTGKSAVLAPIFLAVSLLCLSFALFKTRLCDKTACAAVAASCGMLINIIGEIGWKTIMYMLAGSGFRASLVTAVLGQGSTLINAGIAVIGGVSLFAVLEKPFLRLIKK